MTRVQRLLARLTDTRVLLAVAAAGLLVALAGYAWYAGVASTETLKGATFTPDTDPLAGLRLDNASLLNQDTDRDGIPDLVENYQYGTDPRNWDSRGDGVPDGWLVKYGYDPLTTNATLTLAARPPPEEVPEIYGPAGIPDAYVLTLREAYAFKRPLEWDEAARGPWPGGLNPLAWNTTRSGIPDGWLVRNGLDPTDPTVADVRLPGDDLTVREKYLTGTIPGVPDSDQDGLPDAEERAAHGTDPAKFSTSGAGIGDGWLITYGLDPFNPDVSYQDPDRDGLVNLEEYAWSIERFGSEAAAGRAGLNPLEWASGGAGVPDGWLVRYGLNPLETGIADQVIQRASSFEDARNLAATEDVPAIPDLALTVRDAYRHARPTRWSEATDGVWWGGTNPATPDTDGDTLPDAVEMRGWYVTVTYEVGPKAKPEPVLVKSSPVSADTDGDGLTDAEEYRGLVKRGEGATAFERSFSPSDPGNRDTAFSGLTDAEKLFGTTLDGLYYNTTYTGAGGAAVGLDPTRADTPGRFLKDGAAFQYWHNRSQQFPLETSYPHDSSFTRTADALLATPAGAGKGMDALQALLAPTGDLDDDGVPNVFDDDADGDALLDGLELDARLYEKSEYSTDLPRSATDPANPDTDGDKLHDGWEVVSAEPDLDTLAWKLDPAKRDSLGDGVLDSERNLDGDRFRWVSYRVEGKTVTSVPHEREFNVLDHFQYFQATGIYANPNLLSTAGDNVSDGWKVFWGTTYPPLVLARSREVGDLVPTQEQLQASPLRGADVTTPLGNLSTHRYVRFEKGEGDLVESTPGTYTWSFQEAYNTSRVLDGVASDGGVNPYLADTDGDGMPDPWERFYGLATGAPNPVRPDATEDPDADGLANLDEYLTGDARAGLFGTDPNAEDTDLGGVSDFAEVSQGAASEELLNPLNDNNLLDRSPDRDGDCIVDLVELTGWGGPGSGESYYPASVKTDLKNADTDGDGLLDGRPCAAMSASDPHAQRFVELGMAHSTRPGGLEFMGEVMPSAVTHPLRPDSEGDGIPDGWRTYYGLSGDQSALLERYASYRPAAWNEALHGVWWWGLPPASVPDTLDARDLDSDGLDDRNGEDPFPASSHFNLALGTRDPAEASARLVALTPEEARATAQRWGEGAGDPRSARRDLASLDSDGDGIPDAREGANTTLVNVRVEGTGVGTTEPLALSKHANYTVTGRLVLAADPTRGVPNATVLVSLFEGAPETLVGAGFTDATGAFRIPFHLRTAHAATLPAPGLVLLNRTSGDVEWTTPADLVGLGLETNRAANRLAVWAYNTSATFQDAAGTRHPLAYNFTLTENGATVHRNAIRAPATVTRAIRVTSPTEIRFDGVPDGLAKGAALTGVVRLVDAAGAGIRNQEVTLTWTGETPARTETVQVGADGAFDLASLDDPFRGEAADPGTYVLRAVFGGNSALGAAAAPPAETDVVLRFPTALTARALTPQVAAGEAATFEGTLTGSGAPLQGVVRVALGTARASTTTRTDGTFALTLIVPPDLPAGRQEAAVTFAESDTHQATETQVPLTIKGVTRILDMPSRRVAQGSEIVFEARLVDNTGAPVPRARVDVLVNERFVGAATTRESGNFSIPLELNEAPGPVSIRATFLGDATYAGTTNATSYIVTATPRIETNRYTEPVVRGNSITVRGTLTDALGAPLAHQPVQLSLEGGRASLVLTDARGAFIGAVPVPATSPLGATRVFARYDGTPDGAYGTAVAAQPLVIQARTELTVGFLRAFLGDNTVTGRLVDDRQNPIPNQRVAITFGSLSATGVTDATGAYNAPLYAPLGEAVGTRTVKATFAGTERYAASSAENIGGLVGKSSVTVNAPPVVVRTSNVTFTGLVESDTGEVLEGDIRVTLAEREIGRTKVVDGAYTAVLRIPTTIKEGPATLKVEFSPRGFYLSSSAETTVHVKAQAVLETDLPGLLTAGEPFEATLRLKDDTGKALADVPVLFRVGDGESVTVLTNAKGEARLVATAPAPKPGNGSALLIRYKGTDLVNGTAPAAYALATVAAPAPTLIPLAAIATGTLVLLIAGGAVALVWYRRRHLREIKRVLALGIEQLNAGNEYEATIFLTYKALAKALTGLGGAHLPSDTPGELGAAFKRLVPETEPHLAAFIRVFEEARYSERNAGPRDRDVAIRSFRAIQGALDTRLSRSPEESS